MSNINVMNLPDIQDRLREKHEKFLKDYSFEIDKVVADNRVFSDIVFAKIDRLLVSFKEIGVIDEATIIDRHPLKVARIQKNGFDNYIEVITNGKSIMLQGYGYALDDFESDVVLPRKRINDVTNEDYDWCEFAIILIDYVHDVIYQRKEAYEVKVSSIFKEVPSIEVKGRNE